MDVHASEEEQIEALKKWWKENGSSLITGVLIGLSVLFGVKAWFGYQETQSLNASSLYIKVMEALGRNDTQQVRTFAEEIMNNYSGTGYAPPTALALARVALDQGEYEAARSHLEWALEHADNDALRHTVRLRLLRLLIDGKDFDQAASVLAGVADADAGIYRYGYTVARGDLALAQGRRDEARDAYKAALAILPPQTTDGELVRMKYENLLAQDEVSGEDAMQEEAVQ